MAIVNGTHAMYWDNDALNAAGVYASGDLDNGTLVSRGTLNVDASGNIEGYEFKVALPASNATGLWIVDSPAIGVGVANLYDDPRQFTNKAGVPMSIKRLMAGIDFIEVDATAFAGGELPTGSYVYASVNTSGKLVAATSAPESGTYFSVAGYGSFDVGGTVIPTVVLFCERN